MRFRAKVIVATLIVMPALLTQTSHAQWCAEYSAGGGGESCGFSTFQQCQASVSGVGGFCRPSQYSNPGGSSGRRSSRYRSSFY
jgi:Protein of unknown function (DUF3551)